MIFKVGPIRLNILLYCIVFLSNTVFSQENNDTTATALKELVVTADRNFLKNTKTGFHSLSDKEILSVPVIFGEPDVVKAFQTLPGVSAGLEGFSGLYVRGGENDQNLYLLDKLPLYNVNHLGGVFSTFNAYGVERVDFYKSSFPAEFGGRVSSVADISFRTPDFYKTTGSATLGLISGSVYLSTPVVKGKTAVGISLRRTWLDAVTAPALAILNAVKKDEGLKKIGHYGFTDLSIRLDHKWNKNMHSSLIGFYSHDNFKIGEKEFDPNSDVDFTRKELTKMKWGNIGALANLIADTGLGTLSFDAYITSANARESSEVELDDGAFNRSGNHNKVTETGLKENFHREFSPDFKLTAGMSQSFYSFRPESRYFLSSGKSSSVTMENGNESLGCISLSAYAGVDGNVGTHIFYAGGIRWNSYINSNRKDFTIEPRLSLGFSFSDAMSVKLSYSRMSQTIQQISSNYIYLPSDSWLPAGQIHKPMISDIFSLGFYAITSGKIKISAEGWYKKFNGIADYKEGIAVATPEINWKDKITFGNGEAYGMDITAKGTFGHFDIIASYGLMWNWRKFEDLNQGKRFPAKFDNRNKIDISAGWKFKPNMTLNAHWQYMTGNRATVALYNISMATPVFPDAPFKGPHDPGSGELNNGIDYFQNRNNVRLPAFHRLNLSLTIVGKINSKLNYSWNFGLYNAYCHMNPFAIKKNYYTIGYEDHSWHRKFKTIGLIPILPSVSYTLNF